MSLDCPGRLVAQSNAAASARPDTIRGTVINGITHEPISRAVVLSPDNQFATMADDQGRFAFTFPNRESGSADGAVSSRRIHFVGPDRPLTLTARKPGFLSDDVAAHPTLTSLDQQNVTITLMPEALIVGQIALPAADYLERMQVQVYRRVVRNGGEHWDNAGSVTSRANGSFRFADLQPGEYKLVTRELLDRDPEVFDPRGQLYGYPPVYYPSASDFATAETIHLSAGSTFNANVSPVRREFYPVKIGVTNVPSGIQVEVWPQGRPSPGYSLGFVAQDSAIEGSLPDGAYTIQAFSNGPTSLTGTANVTVSGGPSRSGSMALLPNPSIPVTIREEFQNAQTAHFGRFTEELRVGNLRRRSYLQLSLLPIEAVGYTPAASLRQPTGPDDDSLVIENVRPGTYRVQFNTGVGYISSLTLGGTDLLHSPLRVEAGSALPPMEMRLRDDGAQVEGTVDGAAWSSPNGVVVRSRTEVPAVYFLPLADSKGQFRTAWVSGDGHFQMQQLPPGTYHVLALDHQEPDIQYATDDDLAKYDSQIQVIQVVAGQKTNLRLSLTRRSP